ncbi:MAG: FkbM family methyltransferase [Gemmatimonadetes bacterium]|nr:FkbM family methyltransferase [Gemmatimonadota bacterium]
MPRGLARLTNAILRPLGLGVHRLADWDRARRATYGGAFEHLKRVGFVPRTVIDVGVADGTMDLYRAFPDARHVLVEPVEECRRYLHAICRQFPRVEYVLAAAAREPGRLVINVHQDVARSSAYWESDYLPGCVTTREVPAVTLDQIRRERALEPPMLLKIDVQGAELDVLAGADRTLDDTEYVVLETSLFEFFRGGPLLDEVIRYLSSRGFAVYDVLALQYRPFDGALTMVDVGFVKAGGALRRLHRFHPPPKP